MNSALIALSIIDNKRDTRPVQRVKTWADLSRTLTTKRSVRPIKDGLAFLACIFKDGGKRVADDVEEMTLFVLDVDDGTPPEALRGLWEQQNGALAGAVWSTHSSTSEKPKWRAVFPLIAPVPAKDWKSTWRKLCYHLAEGKMDASCNNPDRLYYLPSCPPEQEGSAFAWTQEGVFLDPDLWPDPPADWSPRPARPRRERVQGDNEGEEAIPTPERLLVIALERLEWDGRNNTALWLACQLRDNRYTQEQAEALIADYVGFCPVHRGDPFTEEEALRCVRNAYGEDPRDPWRKDSFENKDAPLTPWTDYNQKATAETLLPLLLKVGFIKIEDREDGAVDLGHSKRPGHVATLTPSPLTLHVFAPVQAPLGRLASTEPFWVYAAVEHGGDGTAAARELGKQGYGEPIREKQVRVTLERKAKETSPEKFPQGERDRLLLLEKDAHGAEIEHTEGGNVNRLVALHGENLRYVRGVGWRVWSGTHWEGGDAFAERFADQTIRDLYSLSSMLALDASKEEDKAQKSLLSARALRILEWARRSDKSAMLSAMVKRARFHELLVVESIAFDLAPWRIAFPNGTWDRGQWREHRREDYIETLTAVSYDPDADKGDWEEMLGRMTGGDGDLAQMLQDVAGYCFSGASSMRILPWLYGPKGSGKSTFAELLQTALGSCAKPLDWSLLSGQREGERLGATVRNARAVFLPEAGKKRLDADILKSLSGSDRLPGRNLFVSETYTVSPTWALIAVSNEPPNMTAYDDALRDRLAALPFVHKLGEGGQLGFTNGEKIESYRRRTDTPLIRGFVAWAVEGLERVYRSQQIHMAKAALSHTQQFWDDADPLTPFWDQIENGEKRLKEGIKAGELRTAYLAWCENEGVRKPLAAGTPWGDACRAHGLTKERISSGPDKGKEVWKFSDGMLFNPPSERVNGYGVFSASSNAKDENIEGVQNNGLPVHPFTTKDVRYVEGEV